MVRSASSLSLLPKQHWIFFDGRQAGSQRRELNTTAGFNGHEKHENYCDKDFIYL